jgi:hypothetical protein
MDSSLVTFGNWLQNRSFALAVATSDWAYPFVQATHFTGLLGSPVGHASRGQSRRFD